MYSSHPPAPHDKTLVLLSGGLDSAVALALARQNTCGKLYTMAFDYKQRHKKELLMADELAAYYKAIHIEFPLPALDFFTGLKGTDEVTPGTRFPDAFEGLPGIHKEGVPLLPRTWKPGRNIAFFSLAGAYAWWEGINLISCGIHAEDQPGYPDCSGLFLTNMEQTLQSGLSYTVNIWAPLLNMNKTEIVHLGSKLEVPFKFTWSCYAGGDKPCLKCDACIRRAKAFARADIEDPVK